MTDESTILTFPTKATPECPVEVVDEKPVGIYCHGHPRIRVDQHSRTVQCADCGKVIDPFDYIVSGAVSIRRGWQLLEQVQASVREKSEKVRELEKERKRLTPIVRRLAQKAEGHDGVLDMRKPK